ncbi:MAG: M1 family metallopeptidase [Cyclobacteriaceae bacterium]
MRQTETILSDKTIALVSYLTLLFLIGLGDSSCQQSPAKEMAKASQVVRSSNIDVKHVIIDLRFDWDKKQAYGSSTIIISPKTKTDKVSLDAGMLSINSVTLSNGTSLKFEYDGGDADDGLVIALDRMYQPAENISIAIDYRTNWINHSDPNNIWGSFGKGIRFFEPTTTEPKKRKQIWSVGEPESNRYWFPGYDAPDDLRTTEFIATVEKSLMAISNGELIKTIDNNDGTRTFHWRANKPYSNHLTSFVVGEYVDYEQNARNVSLHNFGYPDELEGTKASVVRLPDMVDYFSDITGVEYPHSSYSQVFVQDFGGWMSNMSASTITENMVDDEGTHADFLYLWDITEGEALASQWFGNYLYCRNWSDIWLNKSFAHYLSGMYGASKNGLDEFLIYQLQPDHRTYLGDWNSGNKQPVINPSFEDAGSFVASNHPYFHGASVLHMLRKHVGEVNWKKIIQRYVRQNANKLVSTADFVKVVNEVTGEQMDWFFDQWLYKIGHPVFEVTKSYDLAKKQLTLKIRQTQKVDIESRYPQVEFFTGKVEIEIDNEIKEIWIEPKNETIAVIEVNQEPKLVNFDYQSTWVKEIVFVKSNEELLYQFRNSKDVLGRISAMSQLVTVAKDANTSKEMKEKIIDEIRDVCASNSYWRLRLSAMWQLQNLATPSSTTTPFSWDGKTTQMLLSIIKNERSWLRSNAINFLGRTGDPKYTDLYISYLNDYSDRVVNMAAIALGKTKSPKAFDALIKLRDKPSWKNQSLISTMNGLQQLEDVRGLNLTLETLVNSKDAHWTLGTPIWDHRLAAANTLVALGKGSRGYPLILSHFKSAMKENDYNDIFYNALQVSILADPKGQEVFDALRERFGADKNIMTAVDQLEVSFKNALPKNQ